MTLLLGFGGEGWRMMKGMVDGGWDWWMVSDGRDWWMVDGRWWMAMVDGIGGWWVRKMWRVVWEEDVVLCC